MIQRVTRLTALLVAAAFLTACSGGADTPAPSPTSSSTPTAGERGAVAGSATYQRISKRGKIIVGLRADSPGMAHQDPASGAYSGFEVDLAQLIAANLGLTPQQVTFQQLTPDIGLASVSSGNVDVYLGGATSDQVKQAQLMAAGPYLTAGLALLYRKSGPTVSNSANAAGRQVCSVSNSVVQAQARNAKLTDPDRLVGGTSVSDCVDQLRSGTVDAVVDTLPVLSGYAVADPNNLAVAALAANQPIGCMIALPAGDKALRDRLNQVVRGAVTDGTWQRDYDATLGGAGPKPAPPSVPS